MPTQFKIFVGDYIKVQKDFNEFLRNLHGYYSKLVMTGDKDNIVLGVTYVEDGGRCY